LPTADLDLRGTAGFDWQWEIDNQQFSTLS